VIDYDNDNDNVVKKGYVKHALTTFYRCTGDDNVA
jgi:hypothetical protein